MDTIVTNIPRLGEPEEATLARTSEGRAELDARTSRLDFTKKTPPGAAELLSRPDPAPHPIDVARQRAADLVRNISDNTKLALRRRRDEIDNTIARIEKSESALVHYIGEFAKFNHEGLETAVEVEKLLEEIVTPFKADPPATLTQSKHNE